MRVRLAPAMFLLLLIPAAATAQVGVGGRGRGDGKPDKYAPTNDLPKYPATLELQKFNPVVHLIDQRKRLALSDSQVTVLRALQSRIYERNGDLIARYDSVRRIYNPENANDASSLKADSVRTRSLQQVFVMNAVLDSLVSRREADDLDALALIADEKQKRNAAEMLDKQDAAFAKLMPAGTPARSRRRPR